MDILDLLFCKHSSLIEFHFESILDLPFQYCAKFYKTLFENHVDQRKAAEGYFCEYFLYQT